MTVLLYLSVFWREIRRILFLFFQLCSSAIKLSLYPKLTVWRAVFWKPWCGCLLSKTASLVHPLEQILFQHKAFKLLKDGAAKHSEQHDKLSGHYVLSKTIMHICKVVLKVWDFHVKSFQWLILIPGECIRQLSSWRNALSNCKRR